MTEEKNFNAETMPIKYVFIDIVGFTKNRSVEAQTDIIKSLNGIVTSTIESFSELNDRVILLPTGDGICIAIINVAIPYDIHIPLKLLEKLNAYNEGIKDDDMRTFSIRIGINENIDNVIKDINGKKNVAGAGINYASRIMDMCDGNQIIVGEDVYGILRHREHYMKSFRTIHAQVKHNVAINLYQYISEGHEGLNIDMPSKFKPKPEEEKKLPKVVAYYLAHAIRLKSDLIKYTKNEVSANYATILLWFLAKDSVERADASETEMLYFITYKAEEADIGVKLNFYENIDICIQQQLSDFIKKSQLKSYEEYFDKGYISDYRWVNSMGIAKLKNELKSIWDEFELDQYVQGTN